MAGRWGWLGWRELQSQVQVQAGSVEVVVHERRKAARRIWGEERRKAPVRAVRSRSRANLGLGGMWEISPIDGCQSGQSTEVGARTVGTVGAA